MPSKVKIRVTEARDLPIMDRNQTIDASTDAFVYVIVPGNEPEKTRTVSKSLCPVFNKEFNFEILDDNVLQNAPIEFKVMDKDLYGEELIGVVYIDMNPLLMRTATSSDRNMIIMGWFPLFDTVKGIRGSLHIEVTLKDFIGNSNQFSDASSGVQFFSGSSLASNCFIMQEVLGFVADICVENDAESSWQDYFRKNSKSANDERLRMLHNLSSRVRCEIGKKVIDAGGNAVLGYNLCWDANEGNSGIVARGYGTACRILKVGDTSSLALESNITYADIDQMIIGSFNTKLDDADNSADEIETPANSYSVDSLKLLKMDMIGNVRVNIPLASFGLQSDKILNQQHESRTASTVPIADSNDVQLLSLTEFPRYVRVKLGGLVVARSVKFLGKLEATLSDQETREEWWEELRDEIKGHARILCCSHICGYTETFALYGDVCVLSCMGTAAVIGNMSRKVVSLRSSLTPATSYLKIPKSCEPTHVPYSHSRAPFQFMRLVPCLRCRKKWVPEVVLCTIEPSPALPLKGKGVLLEARTCRTRKAAIGETDAVKLSSSMLPFMEYDVQRQLMLKLKVLGMNAVFCYESRLQIGTTIVVLTATCTAVYLASLPPPPPLLISRNLRDMGLTSDTRLRQLEKEVGELTDTNIRRLASEQEERNLLEFDDEKESVSSSSTSSSSSTDDDDLESPSVSSSSSDSQDEEESPKSPITAVKEVRFDGADESKTNKITKPMMKKAKRIAYHDKRPPFVLDVDDETDADLCAVLEDWESPEGFDMVSTSLVPGSQVHPDGEGQHLTLVKRCRLSSKFMTDLKLNTMIGQMYKELYMRLCYNIKGGVGGQTQVLGIEHNISVFDEEVIEIILSAIVYSTTPTKSDVIAFPMTRSRSESRLSIDRSNRGSIASSDEFFPSSQVKEGQQPLENSPVIVTSPLAEYVTRNVSWEFNERDLLETPRRNRSMSIPVIPLPGGVILSPLSTIPGFRIIKYLGQIQLHFVKDSLAGRSEQSMDSFFHTFITEVNAVIRAHVEALRGNAIVNYRIYPLEAGGRVYRNQAYNMLTLSGDAVEIGFAFS